MALADFKPRKALVEKLGEQEARRSFRRLDLYKPFDREPVKVEGQRIKPTALATAGGMGIRA